MAEMRSYSRVTVWVQDNFSESERGSGLGRRVPAETVRIGEALFYEAFGITSKSCS